MVGLGRFLSPVWREVCRRRWSGRVLLALFLYALGPGVPAFPATGKLRSGPWRVWLARQGPCVSYKGWPIVVGGYIRLYRPHYRGSLLHTFKARRPPAKVIASAAGGGEIRWTAHTREYRLDYTVRLSPPGVRIEFNARVQPKAAFGGVEFAAAFLPPSWIAGAAGQAVTADGRRVRFTVPKRPGTNWNLAGGPARKIVLSTAIGVVTITDPKGARLRLSDMRLNANYRDSAPFFWVFPPIPVGRDRRFGGAVDIAFKPSAGFEALSEQALPVFRRHGPARTAAWTAPGLLPWIFPPPRRVVLQGARRVRIPAPATVRWEGTAPGAEAAATRFAAALTRVFGCGVRTLGAAGAQQGAEIRFELEASAVPGAAGEEEYVLTVDANGARVSARGLRGLQYGGQTLLQLLAAGRDGGLTAPFCRIEDGPDTAERAVHPPRLWPGSNLAYFRRYFQILARARFNLVVWEISGSVRFPGMPWAWRERGSFAPQTVRGMLDYARRLGLEMVPELECLGHANEWLAGDPGDYTRHPWLKKCFEDPGRRTDLCVSNPKTAEVVCAAMDAISALFDHPRFFHVGLDESWRFATCPVCSKRDPARLLSGWLKMLHDHLKQRGMTMMMWHDMLLSKKRFKGAVANGNRTEAALAGLPRDIVICNWQYQPGPAFPVSRYFRKQGFPVLICPWYRPEDVFDCAQAAQRLHCGLLSTNWNAFIERKPMPPFARLAGRDLAGSLLAAAYCWRAPKHPNALLSGLLPARDVEDGEVRRLAGGRFTVVDFRGMPPVPALPFPGPDSLQRGTDGLVRVAGIPFLPPAVEKAGAGVSLGTGRGVRAVPVGGRISDLYVLAAIRRPPTPGFTEFQLRFHYPDGTSVVRTFVEAGIAGPRFPRLFGLVFHGRYAGFAEIGRYNVLRFVNPHPDRAVAGVDVVQAEGAPVGLVVAGVSARVSAGSRR